MRTYLEFLELLEDHVVGHVVKKPIARSEDNVSKLDVKGRAVGSVRAESKQRNLGIAFRKKQKTNIE